MECVHLDAQREVEERRAEADEKPRSRGEQSALPGREDGKGLTQELQSSEGCQRRGDPVTDGGESIQGRSGVRSEDLRHPQPPPAREEIQRKSGRMGDASSGDDREELARVGIEDARRAAEARGGPDENPDRGGKAALGLHGRREGLPFGSFFSSARRTGGGTSPEMSPPSR